jgi:hypothetical protein
MGMAGVTRMHALEAWIWYFCVVGAHKAAWLGYVQMRMSILTTSRLPGSRAWRTIHKYVNLWHVGKISDEAPKKHMLLTYRAYNVPPGDPRMTYTATRMTSDSFQ